MRTKNLGLRNPVFRYDVLLVTVIVFMLVFTVLSPAVFTAEREKLLQEIEEVTKKIYLYPVGEDTFPLRSLEDVEGIFKDPHSTYLSEEQFRHMEEKLGRSFGGVGIYIGLQQGQVIVESTVPGAPAERAGLRGGDVITAVDRRPVAGASLDQVAAMIRGEPGTAVNITVRREGRIFNFNPVREKITLSAISHEWLEERLALARVSFFGQSSGIEMSALLESLRLEGLRGLVLDLRGNQGGYYYEALEMASLFLDSEEALVQVKQRSLGWQEKKADGTPGLSLPLVVLVDGETASAAEIFAAALKENGAAVLVGETTYGKGTIQVVIELVHGGFLKLTTAEFAGPAGGRIEGRGVEPHFLVPLGPGDGPGDGPVQAAVELLRRQVERGEGAEDALSFLEAGLQGLHREGGTPLPRVFEGELYYPLRPLLQLTGRTISGGDEPGEYIFDWSTQTFTINLCERSITWEDVAGRGHSRAVVLYGGSTYVTRQFLEDDLALPIY